MAKKTKTDTITSIDEEHVHIESDDVIETSTEADKLVDVRPDFHTMDESGIKEYEKLLTNFLRDRGATVRTMKVEEKSGPKTTSGPVSVAGTDDNPSVFEAVYEWEYDPKVPQRIVGVSPDRLQAIRNCIDEAFHKRWAV